ncbi:hypothetical protein EYF80_046406 [Liparis tanakae]|uniref:Uncharacterized protein n=1 Tax=Liparis tanakae TaxID=230148 RepID=A0A4Z2FSM1_9TELE|nr:hypothetical protein EYF80_046406 [Liparis tanakae]
MKNPLRPFPRCSRPDEETADPDGVWSVVAVAGGSQSGSKCKYHKYTPSNHDGLQIHQSAPTVKNI